MKISVVIPTKNRVDSLNRLLESIYSQNLKVDEIIIVDQSKENNEKKILVSSGKEKIIYKHDKCITGSSEARNKGAELSKGDYIYFFDDDLILYNDFIFKMNQIMQKYPEIYGLCGSQELKKEKSKLHNFGREIFKKGPFKTKIKDNRFKYLSEDLIVTKKISGGITVYRKEIFEEFKFDENMKLYCLGEDYDLSYRASNRYIMAKTNNAIAIHKHESSGRYNMRQDYDSRICFYYYFYLKNLSHDKKNKKYLYLVLLGVIIDALTKVISERSFEALLGIKDGHCKVKNKFKGAYCIDYKKINFDDEGRIL